MTSPRLWRARKTALVVACAGIFGVPASIVAVAQAPAPMPAPAPAPQEPAKDKPAPDTVLATVNGKKITQFDVDVAGEDLGQNLSQQLKGKARDAYVLDYLIDSTLVTEKAKADKLDQTPEFGRKLDYAKDKLLMEAMLTRIAKGATEDASLHKIYDEAAKAQKPEEEIHARHILVPTEADAQAALKRLKAGEDFAKVAKEMSKDPGSQGGDLGWFTRGRMVPEFADAAFKLKEGELSQPVKSQFGWHIIQVQGRRQKTFPPFDQVKEQLLRYAVQKAQSDLIVELRKTAKIDRSAEAPKMAPPESTPPANK